MTQKEAATLGAGAHALALDLDEEGFLRDPHRWSMQTSRILAEMNGINPLGPDHWAIIFYLREHHLTYGSLPPMSQVCRTRGLNSSAVGRLFGGCLEAWRIAGLPYPGEEARSYMS